MQNSAAEPDFSPGVGWHKPPGFAMPGSASDLLARAEQAFRCWVLPMRRNGTRPSAESLMDVAPVYGGLLMMQEHEGWDAHLFEAVDFTRGMLFMARAQLVRDRAGCRLYQGYARDTAGIARVPQTWLCTPSPERTREILAAMAEREWQ